MAITPFASTGDVLTATNFNYLPRGVLGYYTTSSNFATSATHTTFQDDGLSVSVTYGASRVLKVSVGWTLYPGGGLQSIYFKWLRGSTQIGPTGTVDSASLNAGGGNFFTFSWVFNGPAAGATETFKTQIAASTSNTAVNTFSNKWICIEDLGAQ